MALTKSDLAEKLTDDVSLDKLDAKVLVEAVFESIREALTEGNSVRISGFGNWEPREKEERPGRNPKTGEDIPIAARRVVIFGAGQKLKQLVEDNSEQIRKKDTQET